MKTFTWKFQDSLRMEGAKVFRLYTNNKPTWSTVSLEAVLDARTCYALDIEAEIAIILRQEQSLSFFESMDAVKALWKCKHENK